MKISYSSVTEALMLNVGYGIAGFGMVTSLQKLGHTVPYQDGSAPVEFHWSNADRYRYSNPHQYKIMMSTWESYPIPQRWKKAFDIADEVWTTSPVVAGWYEEVANKPVKVYEHGIDSIWVAKEREVKDKIMFLHDGEPAPRKNGQLAVDAFRAAFGNRSDVHLTIKAQGYTRIQRFYDNVTVVKDQLLPSEMVNLYHDHDVLVVPSEAEGFGLPGLQAICSGMPAIINQSWAPYRDFIIPELALPADFARSIHQESVPGYSFPPNFDDLVSAYLYVAKNIKDLSKKAYATAPAATDKYNWLGLTEKAFAHVVSQFN